MNPLPPPPYVATLISLFQNLTLLLSLALIYTLFWARLNKLPRQQSAVATGVIFGVFAIIAAFSPVLLPAGARFDGRTVMIAVSGLFGGPVGALVTTAIFLLFRVVAPLLGLLPPITLAAIVTAFTSAAASIWAYYRYGKDQAYRPWQLLLLGDFVAAQNLIWTVLANPAAMYETLRVVGGALLIVYPSAMLLIGLLLAREIGRTRLERELRESEQRFREMAESIDQVFTLRDVQTGKILYLSPSFEKIWGRPVKMALDSVEAFYDTVHADDRERYIRERMEPVAPAGRVREFRIVRPDGVVRYVRLVSYPVIEADGVVRRVAGIGEDVTQRKQMEEALRSSQHFVERITDTIPDSLYIYDLTLRAKVYENHSLAASLGYSVEQIADMGPRYARQLLHPHDFDQLTSDAYLEKQHNLTDGGVLETEYRLKNAAGEWRWFYSRDTVFQRAPDGTVRQLIGIAQDVTERKDTVEALRQSQHFVDRVTSTVPDLIYVYDVARLDKLFENRKLGAVLGYSPGDVETMGSRMVAMIMHPDDYARIAAPEYRARQMALAEGDTLEEEYRLRHANGEWRWFASSDTPFVRSEDGTLLQMLGIAKDITDRKRSEEALRQSQRFVEQITTAVPDAIFVHDLGQHMNIYMNREIASLGYSEKQLQAFGANMTAVIFHPDDFAQLPAWEEQQKQMRDGEVLEYDYRLKDANGSWHWITSRHSPFLRDADGNVTQVIGVARDITKRRQIEEQLRQTQYLNERITNTVPDLLYVYDFAQQKRVFANRDLLLMLGYTPEQAQSMGGRSSALVHPDDLKRVQMIREQNRYMPEAGIMEWEYRIRDARGEWRWLYSRETPFEFADDGAVTQALGISRDVTDRKRSEEKLQRYAEKLEQNNEELQMFAYTASHDLQEPLRKMQAFGDRLQTVSGDALNEQGKDYLQRMMNASSRMQTLIQDLLAYSRVSRMGQPFDLVDLSEVAQAVCSDLEVAIARAGAQVEIEPLYAIEADPTQMRQLLQNLIGNALKFHAPDRAPVVKVSGRMIEAESDENTSGRLYYKLTVSDNGIGFEEKYAERIFGMFQRLHGRTEYEGTGIGLAICRKIAERHHGTIRATSQPGQGATFIVTIPVKQPVEEALA